MSKRTVRPLAPYKPWKPTPEQVEAGIAALEIEQPAPAVKAKRGRPEFVLQCSAVKQLRAMLAPGYIVASHCAEGASFSEGSRAKMQGQIKGWPDTEVCGDGFTWRIEWKSKTGTLSPDQKRVHEQLRRAGQEVAVCRSIEDAVAFLKKCGAEFGGQLS